MKKMKTFMDFKNELVKEIGTDITLVPEDQIEEFDDFDWKGFYEQMTVSDYSLCTYCYLFINYSCVGCPMFKADNCCKSLDSTYDRVVMDIDPCDLGIFNNSEDKIKELKDFVLKNMVEESK